MKSLHIIACCLLLPVLAALAQDKTYPTVGDACPPFKLFEVQGYEKDVLSNADFIGKKWMILDFWSKTCKACLESFPKIDELQSVFKNEIQFVLVGDNSKKYNKGIEELYNRVKERQNLSLTAAFDSTLRKSFYFRVIPHLVIVNPEGNIYAITGSKELTRQKLRALVNGEEPDFALKVE